MCYVVFLSWHLRSIITIMMIWPFLLIDSGRTTTSHFLPVILRLKGMRQGQFVRLLWGNCQNSINVMASPHDQRKKALAEPFLCSSVRFLCFWLSSLGSDVINFGIAGDQEICSKKFTGLSVSFSFSTSVLLGDILRRSLSCSLSHRREFRETAAAKSLQKR